MPPVDAVEVADRHERASGLRGDSLEVFERDHRPWSLGSSAVRGRLAIASSSTPVAGLELSPRRGGPVNAREARSATPVLTIGRGYVTKSGRPAFGLPPWRRLKSPAARGLDGEPGLADDLILQFGYFGIFFVLVLGGLGLPVPEEAPIILAAILSRKGTMHWVPALASCFAGVLVGDFVVYFLGFFYGEKVLSFPLTRKFLTKDREAQIKGYFHRHGVKILILGRFAVGFRTAAYLTAGILRLPTLSSSSPTSSRRRSAPS